MTEKTALDDPRWVKLSAERQDKLLEEHRYSDVEFHNWWDFTYDWFKEQMKTLGVEVSDIAFSGFCSQGDGAWFAGHIDDWYLVLREIGQLLKAHSYWPHSEWSFQSESYHRGYMRYDCDMPADENPYDEEDEPLQFAAFELRNPNRDAVNDIAKDVQGLFEDKANELYRSLEEEYDYLTSDEHVVESLLNNMTDEELADPDEELEDEISLA